MNRIALIVAALILVAAGSFAALAWAPAIPSTAPPAPNAFPPATVARGAALAALGDCAVCHTSENGHPFAGGRAVAAVDSGQAISPDGIRNQIEGAMIQSASWTLFEEVRFDRTRITSTDWSSYPILRFPAAPESLEVHVIDRPGLPFLGTGEAGQGPMAAAIANALCDATGARLRDLPLSPTRIKAAIGV